MKDKTENHVIKYELQFPKYDLTLNQEEYVAMTISPRMGVLIFDVHRLKKEVKNIHREIRNLFQTFRELEQYDWDYKS